MKNKSVLTIAGGGGSSLTANSNVTDSQPTKYGTGSAGGFTMAEILLSLTIIGVVAAITLPSLTGNINERTWNTQRKALYARFSQAIALMPALNGYGTLTEDASGNLTTDTAAETFVTEGLAKVLKINNICDSEHLPDCGIPTKFTTLAGSDFGEFPKTLVALNDMFDGSVVWSAYNSDGTDEVHRYKQADTKAAAFETQNGESIAVYYNPNCLNDLDKKNTGGWYYSQPRMCANFIYDLNGLKGPNTVGKDIGVITALYPSDSVVVAPLPVRNSIVTSEHSKAAGVCKAVDTDSRIANYEEMISIFANKYLFDIANGGGYWTSSVPNSTTAFAIYMPTGHLYSENRTRTLNAVCIKR